MIKRLTFLVTLLISDVTGWGQIAITGTVVDRQSPVPGVNVVEKGTMNVATTNYDGTFSIEVTDLSSTLVFSFVGMVTQDFPLNGRNQILVKVKWDCAKDFFDSQKIMIYANSGVINNPLGGQLEISSPWILGGVLKGLYSYQTNLDKNTFQNAQLEFDHFISNCEFDIDFRLHYRQVSFDNDINSKALSFETELNLRTINLIVGYSILDFNGIEIAENIVSSGAIVGFQTYLNLPLHPTVMAKAAFYKGKIEYQASIKSGHKRFLWFVKFYKLNSFNELSFGIGTHISYLLKRQRK